MTFIRRRLIVIVLAVMACQGAGLAAAPLVLCQMGDPASADTDGVTCTCTHGANAECPMHKQRKTAPASGENRWCAGCRDSQEMVLSTFIGFAGTIVSRHQAVTPERVSESLGAFIEHPLEIVRPPAPPPPRS